MTEMETGDTRGNGTICKPFVYGFVFAHVVHAAVGRVVLRFPVPAEKVSMDPLVVEIKICTDALNESERKSGEERISSTPS